MTEWRVWENEYHEDLQDLLNRAEREGWEVFQVLGEGQGLILRRKSAARRTAENLIDFAPALGAAGGAVQTRCALCGNPAVRPIDVDTEKNLSFTDGEQARVTFLCESGCRYQVEFGFHRGGCFVFCLPMPREARRHRTPDRGSVPPLHEARRHRPTDQDRLPFHEAVKLESYDPFSDRD